MTNTPGAGELLLLDQLFVGADHVSTWGAARRSTALVRSYAAAVGYPANCDLEAIQAALAPYLSLDGVAAGVASLATDTISVITVSGGIVAGVARPGGHQPIVGSPSQS